MKVIFTGVGDAFDGSHTNVSLWLETQPDTLSLLNELENPAHTPKRILFDCGFTVPYALWRHALPTEKLDIIHFK